MRSSDDILFQNTKPIDCRVNDAQMLAASQHNPLKESLLFCCNTLLCRSHRAPHHIRSHSENFGVSRLYLFALCLHRGGVGLEQFQGGQRRVARLLLDQRMKRTMGETVDQHLLALGAEEETMEQARGGRIGRALE